MLSIDNVTVSFRLNLNREEDTEIQRCLINEQMMKSFGGKSKFIKMALIRFIHNFKQEENDKYLVCEMNNQRTAVETRVSSEADRIIDEVKLIVRDEMERFAGRQLLNRMQSVTEQTASLSGEAGKTESVYGMIPLDSDEDVSEDVMDFMDSL